MHIAIYVPLAVSGVAGLGVAWLARVLPPAVAAMVITVGGCLLALGSSMCLLLLGVVGVLDLTRLDDPVGPVPEPVAFAAAALVVLVGVRVARVLVRHTRDVLTARRLTAHLGGTPGSLVLLPDLPAPAPPAPGTVFAVASRGGRIVASQQLLFSLAARDRAALLAHEASHLSHRHDRFRFAARLAAALDPLLAALPRALEFSTERWADEDAAREVGSRTAAARALATVTLGASGHRPRRRMLGGAMGGDGSDVVARVQALLVPAPAARPLQVLLVAALTATSVAAAVHAQLDASAVLCRAMVDALR